MAFPGKGPPLNLSINLSNEMESTDSFKEPLMSTDLVLEWLAAWGLSC